MARSSSLGLVLLAAAFVGSLAYYGWSHKLGPFQPAPPIAAKKLFVTGVLSGVTSVDLASGKELARIDTGLLPHNLVLSPDGK